MKKLVKCSAKLELLILFHLIKAKGNKMGCFWRLDNSGTEFIFRQTKLGLCEAGNQDALLAKQQKPMQLCSLQKTAGFLNGRKV